MTMAVTQEAFVAASRSARASRSLMPSDSQCMSQVQVQHASSLPGPGSCRILTNGACREFVCLLCIYMVQQ